jgi:gliding motility-associated-like protein
MIEVTQPPPFEATSLGATSVTCNGDNNGSIIISVTGGTLPYASYLWDNTSQMIPDPENLGAGSYTLTVTDAQGCITISETIIIEEPEAIVLTTTEVAAACNGSSDGSIALSVTGGTPPYSYNWNNGAYINEDLTNIPAGQYTVVVTDAEGCSQTTATTIGQPQALEIVIDNVSNYGGYNVTCWNSTDGTAEAMASGGTEPFSFAWSNGMNTGQIEDLSPGTYIVTVTDGGGCTNTNQVNLTAPLPMDATVEAIAADCYGESDGQVIVTSVNGGAAPYMYSIGASFSTVNQFVNLPEGTYEVTVQDVNGCEWTTTVEVTEPEEFVVDLGEDVEILLGDSTQLQPLFYPGGSVIDTFVWKEREVIDLEPWVTPTETQSYSIVVTNQSGCKAEDMILVRVKKERLVYIPNTFTPNNDGFNDIFWIQTGRGVASINNFRIFSRWGELVYENLTPQVGITYADPNNGWDGKLNGEPMNPGVFVYVVEVTFIDGSVEIYKGDVTLKK